MCKVFSGYVTEKEGLKVNWHVHSHEDQIEMDPYAKSLDRKTYDHALVRVEFVPPGDPKKMKLQEDGLPTFEDWTLTVDGTSTPEWYDPDWTRNKFIEALLVAPSITVDVATVHGQICFCSAKIGRLSESGHIVMILPTGSVGSNYGNVRFNTGSVSSNHGSVSFNDGSVGSNYGSVSSNSDDGSVRSNDGSVRFNYGSVSFNDGNVRSNYGSVRSDDGNVRFNTGSVGFNDERPY